MSGRGRGDQQHQQNNYAGAGGGYQSNSGGGQPPPLRQPNTNSDRGVAAVKTGYGNNGTSSRGRGDHNLDSFPEIGQFSAEDYNVDDGQNQQQNNVYQQQEEEGLLPPLRRPHTNEIPADVLAVMLKDTNSFDVLAPSSPHSQNQQQNADHRNSSSHQSQSPSSQTPTTPRNNTNNVYYQSQSTTPLSDRSSGSPRPPPQHQQQQTHPKMHQNSPRFSNNYNSLTTASAGKQSGVKVQLSANAKEFVPSSTSSPTNNRTNSNNSSNMTTQEESELAQAVAQFQLQNHNLIDFNDDGSGYASQDHEQHSEDSSDYVLSTITDSIMDLTTHPANFSRCAKVVTEVLKDFCLDLDTLNVVVTLLVEQSISNPNFCYSGARLAEVLVKNGIAVNNATFKGILLTRCQEEFTQCIANMQNDPMVMMRCRGLLMYFGELFMNIRTTGDPTKPLIVLGLGVLEMMQNLVKDPSHENIKCIFQVLKLVGWDIENSLKNDKVNSNFEQLLKDMSFLCMASSDTIQPQTKYLLDTLFELKNKKWNREEPSQESGGDCNSPAASSASTTSTVSSSTYSGGGGSVTSNNVYELPESDEDDYDDCILIDDEPAEVQRAYEEFLQSNK